MKSVNLEFPYPITLVKVWEPFGDTKSRSEKTQVYLFELSKEFVWKQTTTVSPESLI